MNTDFDIRIDLVSKTATTRGVIGFREEDVSVELINIGTSLPSSLKLGIIKNGTLYAECTSFSSSGSNAVGALNLNTTELSTIFDGRSDQATIRFSACVWDNVDNTLLVNDTIEIINNPYSDDLNPPSPVPADEYMTKSVYDNNDDGKVDHAELADLATTATTATTATSATEAESLHTGTARIRLNSGVWQYTTDGVTWYDIGGGSVDEDDVYAIILSIGG